MILDHGTRARYQAGCRCSPCTTANATYAAYHRAGLTFSEHDDQARRDSNRRTAAVSRYLGGESSTDVAARFGVSAQQVRRWVRAAGHDLRGTHTPPAWVGDAAGRFVRGESIADLARRYDVTYRQVQYHLTKAGLDVTPQRRPPAPEPPPRPLQPDPGWCPPTVGELAAHEPVDGWQDAAECRGLDPDLFHPERGEPTRYTKAVCSRCPVALDCATFAVRNLEKHGVWGGLSERERRVYRRQLRLRDAA